jgi:hypothetical protein
VRRHFLYLSLRPSPPQADQFFSSSGAFNQLWASTVPQEEVKSGGYYNSFATLNNAPLGASDNKIGEELWEWTTEELQPFL